MVLRIKKSITNYKLACEPEDDDFWVFWNKIRGENKLITIKIHRRKLEGPPRQRNTQPATTAIERATAPRKHEKLAEESLEQNVKLLFKTKLLVAQKIQERLTRRRYSLMASSSPSQVDTFTSRRMTITSDFLEDDKFRRTYGLQVATDAPLLSPLLSPILTQKGSPPRVLDSSSPPRQLQLSERLQQLALPKHSSPPTEATPAPSVKGVECNSIVVSTHNIIDLRLQSDAHGSIESNQMKGRWRADPEVDNDRYTAPPRVRKNPRRERRELVNYPLKTVGSECEEFLFDPSTLSARISFVKEGKMCIIPALPITSIFATESEDGLSVNLYSKLDSPGYIGKMTTKKWTWIQREIVQAIDNLPLIDKKVEDHFIFQSTKSKLTETEGRYDEIPETPVFIRNRMNSRFVDRDICKIRKNKQHVEERHATIPVESKYPEVWESVAIGHVAMGEEVRLLLAGNHPPTAPKALSSTVARSPRMKIYRPIKESTRRVIHRPTIEPTPELFWDEEVDEEIPEEDKAVMLVETNRIMQLYFAKKFLQLDLVVDVHMTFYDASEALLANPNLYGLIFISLQDLALFSPEDMRKILLNFIAPTLDPLLYTIVVYGSFVDDDICNILDQCGISNMMEEPYTLASIKVGTTLSYFIMCFILVTGDASIAHESASNENNDTFSERITGGTN